MRTGLVIKAQGRFLRRQIGRVKGRIGREMRHGRLDQGRTQARAARLGQHTDPADLAHPPLGQKPRRSNRLPVQPRQKMHRHATQIIKLIRLGDALFLDEHRPAQASTGRTLCVRR